MCILQWWNTRLGITILCWFTVKLHNTCARQARETEHSSLTPDITDYWHYTMVTQNQERYSATQSITILRFHPLIHPLSPHLSLYLIRKQLHRAQGSHTPGTPLPYTMLRLHTAHSQDTCRMLSTMTDGVSTHTQACCVVCWVNGKVAMWSNTHAHAPKCVDDWMKVPQKLHNSIQQAYCYRSSLEAYVHTHRNSPHYQLCCIGER